LIETNITDWRRAVAGDLTSAFDFKSPNSRKVHLPSTASYAPTDTVTHPDFSPAVPATQSLPKQEPGIRPARAVPYDLDVSADTDLSNGKVTIRFGNSGKAAAVYQVRSGNAADGPWTYTVSPHARVVESFTVRGKGQSKYDLSVYGPNGYFRAYKGSVETWDKANLSIDTRCESDHGLTLDVRNKSRQTERVRIYDAYDKRTLERAVGPNQNLIWHWSLEDSYGWYDLTVTVDSDSTFKQQLAGHIETGKDSMSDPLLGE